MGFIDSLKAIFSRRDSVQAARSEDIPPSTDRPRSDQGGFEGMKDDDAVARGATPVAPTAGPGTPTDLREEFESDQEAPRDPAP